MTVKHRYTFLIDPALDAGLKALKARDGIAEGEAIRRALAAFLSAKGVAVEGKAARPRGGARKRA